MIAALASALLILAAAADEDPVRKDLQRLESEDVREREDAATALVARGPKLLARLRREVAIAADPEVRARLGEVASRIKLRTPLSVHHLREARLDVEFKGARVTTVLREIERRTGFAVDLELIAGEDVELGDMAFKGVAVETLLHMATKAADLAWEIEDREKIVVMGADRKARQAGVVRILDVRELTGYVYDKTASRAGLDLPQAPRAVEAVDYFTEEDFACLIKASVVPGSWSDATSLQIARGFMILSHRAAVCDEVEQFTQRLRALWHGELRVQVILLAMKDAGVEKLLEGGTVRPADLKKEAVIVADHDLTSYANVAVQRFSGRVIPFISNYGPTGEVGRGEVRDGVSLSVRATPGTDRKIVKLDLSADVCRLQGLERVPTQKGDVQVPTLETAEVRVMQTLPTGEWAVVSRQPNPSGNGAEFPHLVTIVRVDLKK